MAETKRPRSHTTPPKHLFHLARLPNTTNSSYILHLSQQNIFLVVSCWYKEPIETRVENNVIFILVEVNAAGSAERGGSLAREERNWNREERNCFFPVTQRLSPTPQLTHHVRRVLRDQEDQVQRWPSGAPPHLLLPRLISPPPHPFSLPPASPWPIFKGS